MLTQTDYDAELSRIETEIASLTAKTHERDAGRDRARRIVYKRYQHASLRGDFRALRAVDGEVDALIDPQCPDPDMLYLKANIGFKFGFAPLPVAKDPVQPYDAVGIISPSTIKNPDAVWALRPFRASSAVMGARCAWKALRAGEAGSRSCCHALRRFRNRRATEQRLFYRACGTASAARRW